MSATATADPQPASSDLSRPPRRPELAVRDARRLLRLPETAPLELAELPEGRFNWCWMAASDQRRYLIKLNADQGISHLRRLQRATRRATEAGVHVPPVTHVGHDPRSGPFLVQTWLDGQTLTDWLDAGGAGEAGPQPWTALGRQIGLLHSSKPTGARAPRRVSRIARARELAGMLDQARESGLLGDALVRATLTRAAALLAETVDHDAVLCHLDIHPGNVLVTGPAAVALLDFDHARPADPVYDFVKVQLWCARSPEQLRLVLDGYTHVRALRQDRSFWSALAFYRVVNHISYCLYWSRRDPRQVGEWVAALTKEIEAP
jgi:aminoglycoside phosphotransferase (APT) family kinase protein